MLTEKQYKELSDQVYLIDSSRKDIEEKIQLGEEPYYNLQDKNLGKYKILKMEDNQENGMQAMAVAPIGADGQPDYSQITITYAGTNADDRKDTTTDLQMIGYGITDIMAYLDSNDRAKVVESQAVSALRFAEEVRKQFRNSQITTTGHSLGEALAIFVALKNGWDNMGSHGPDIHNMISPEELAYMRAHPEQFKNYRGNYDYIGGITGNATVTGIHLDYGFAPYTHDLTYLKFNHLQQIIHGNGDVVWETAKKDIDINGDGTVDFHVKGIDPKPRDLLSADQNWISSGDKIQVNPELLRILKSNITNRLEDMAYIVKIIEASRNKNDKIGENFNERKEEISESIKSVFKEAGLPYVLFKLHDTVGVVMKNRQILNDATYTAKLDKTRFYSTQEALVNGLPIQYGRYNTDLYRLKLSCGELAKKIHHERIEGVSSIAGDSTPTLMKSWEVIEEETQKLLKDSVTIFEGEGLREGKLDGIRESLTVVLEVIAKNTTEITLEIMNIIEFVNGVAENFEQIDVWLGQHLEEGTVSPRLGIGTVPANYKAYLERHGIFDDVKDVLQAFDKQVEKRSSEYAKKVENAYSHSLNKLISGLQAIMSEKSRLKELVTKISSDFNESVFVREIKDNYNLLGDLTVKPSVSPETYWGKLEQLYPDRAKESVQGLQSHIIPAMERIEHVIWQIRDVNNSLALLAPKLKPIIEEGVYRAFDLDEIVKGQNLVAAIANRLGQELNHVIQVMEAEGMQASAISTLKAKLSQTHQLIRYYVRFVNDCFGDNEYSDYAASSTGPNTEAIFTLN
ncbi:SA1320 family protein [Granulicatella adiacens]